MSGLLWSRRPSAPDTSAGSSAHSTPRPRTTSGGGLAAISNVFGLSKAKSRERLRNTGTTSLPAKTSSNRQTVVSTESGSSDMWPNEPTTPSSASDTKRSFQGMGMGVGIGDDPFARPPVFVTKDKPESPVPSLAAFPEPPVRHPRTATQRNHSTGPLLDPGPSRHLHPPTASPKSSTSKLGSRASSPNRSRSTSASSSVPPSAKSPRTPPPMIPCVSPADMYAHADEVSWSPESMYDPPIDIRPRQYEDDRQDVPSIRRGQSAHAVLTPSARLAPVPRLIHSASSSHLTTPAPPSHLSPHTARAGLSAASGMGSMTALMSGIAKGLEDEPAKGPPKRPSRSELRNKSSTASLVPPTRKASLNALRDVESAHANGLSSVPESDGARLAGSSRSPVTRALEPFQSAPRSLEPFYSPPALEPQSPELLSRTLESLQLSPDSTPIAVSPPRHRTTSSPARTGLRPTPTSPRLGPSSPRLGPSSPRLGHSSPRLGPASPHLGPAFPSIPTSQRPIPTSPRRNPTSPTSPRPSEDLLRRPDRFSEDSQDLDNYDFALAPTIQETDAQSISFSELGVQLGDDEDVWSDDGVTFHHGGTDSLLYVSADTRYARRPPPSPTSLPFMAGNARRRVRQDTVYPSGVHTIPIADQAALAALGKDEFKGTEDAVVGQSHIDLAPASIEEEEHEFPTPPASSPSPVNPLERISSTSAGSQTSSCSSIAPDAVPPQTISSHLTFSKHARTGSYSDSELDFEFSRSVVSKPKHTQTAVAWRCGAGNHEKCCQTRAMEGSNSGPYKCCAERTASGKNARCCAASVGKPCQRARVSSTSSGELKRQRSLHFSSLPGAPGSSARRAKGFFHRPHTSHGKSTSSALLDDETRAIIQSKTREDPGPQSPASDVFAPVVSSPPTSPTSRHEFKAKPIISRAILHDHLKESLAAPSPVPSPDPIKSPKLEPTRARSNTTTTDTSGSVRSAFSNPSGDAPALMRPLPMRPRRIQHVTLPSKTTTEHVQQPRRFVQSIASVVQPAGLTRPPPSFSSGSSIASTSGISSIHSSSGFTGLPPPRRHAIGRNNTQPIVSFISSHSAPTPHAEPNPAGLLRHRSSRESYESSRTVRHQRSIPFRENHTSFFEFGVEEEESEQEDTEHQPQPQPYPSRPTLQHTQSFLDLSGRQSGDTMRETDAMFS